MIRKRRRARRPSELKARAPCESIVKPRDKPKCGKVLATHYFSSDLEFFS